ncbi:hypothetical protein [Streptomyces klenkii]|uniref:hypothetical protein n=1 Tax=Streptomyces klenkii TaxID=1420899 RepID=UPI001319FDAB|nr:hypothetical protein [Streptomyces klenkii]
MSGPRRGGRCNHGRTPCGAPARFYPCGWRCDRHQPALLAGRAPPPHSDPIRPTDTPQ